MVTAGDRDDDGQALHDAVVCYVNTMRQQMTPLSTTLSLSQSACSLWFARVQDSREHPRLQR
jgi:hypothetical protein